jgi:hypothetical protein
MPNRSLALLLGAALLAGVLGCGPSGPTRRPRSADDEERQSKSDARMGPLRTVWEHTSKFKACYDDARRTQSDLVIRITVDIAVDGKGRVERAFVTSAKPIDDTLKKCLARVAEGITFPPSGDSFSVKPAFVFQP